MDWDYADILRGANGNYSYSTLITGKPVKHKCRRISTQNPAEISSWKEGKKLQL
jgi:hypothetical protein